MDFAGENAMIGNQMLPGVRARPDDSIRAAKWAPRGHDARVNATTSTRMRKCESGAVTV